MYSCKNENQNYDLRKWIKSSNFQRKYAYSFLLDQMTLGYSHVKFSFFNYSENRFTLMYSGLKIMDVWRSYNRFFLRKWLFLVYISDTYKPTASFKLQYILIWLHIILTLLLSIVCVCQKSSDLNVWKYIFCWREKCQFAL